MISVHPTESAGDGIVIEQSTSIKSVDHFDRVIRCAQCGFYVDLDKRATGPSVGAIPLKGTQTVQTVNPPAPGVSFTDKYFDVVDTNTGCPFCNSLDPFATKRGSKDSFIQNSINLENY